MRLVKSLLAQLGVHEEGEIDIALPDAASTEALGVALARLLCRGDVVCLTGSLGAGKTTLARGVIRALTGEREAPSPTYTLVQSYAAPGAALWHADLYRLEKPDESEELGLDDAFEDGIVLIEWPERIADRLPSDRLDIGLEDGGSGDTRRALLSERGRWRGRINGR